MSVPMTIEMAETQQKQEEGNVYTINSIPPELLVQTFSLFLSLGSLSIASQVSHAWHKAVEQVFHQKCNELTTRERPQAFPSHSHFYRSLLKLSHFESNTHINDIKYLNKDSKLLKIGNNHDSNNIFIDDRLTCGECFVEFKILGTYDELIIGVTAHVHSVGKVSGWANLGHPHTWTYSKGPNVSSPMFAFGKHSVAGSDGFAKNDLVAIYVNADHREVCWFKNGKFMRSNLPEHPLPDYKEIEESDGYGIYVLVDEKK